MFFITKYDIILKEYLLFLGGNTMQLTFLGKDSGFGEKNNSAYYETENKLVLIDCGFTVFNTIKNKFDFSKYDNIEIIITHLHPDHAGSLSQLILYLWYIHQKKVTVLSKCKYIKNFLQITGTPEEAYQLKKSTSTLKFIKTQHTPLIDSYGFVLDINNKKILYTGDTSTLNPFRKYFSFINELYVDISISGIVHLKIDDVIEELTQLKEQNIDIYLMHLDNKEKIKEITNNKFNI